jgi:hypothetical protein
MRRPRSDKGAFHESNDDEFRDEIDEDDKKCPDALRFVLRSCRWNTSTNRLRSETGLLHLLNEAWPEGRLGQKRFSRSIFRATEDGIAPFHYMYLEGYARAMGVPSAYLLIVSRAIADLADDGPEGAIAMVDRFQRALEDLKEILKADSPSTAEVRELIDKFRELQSQATP